jgi:hypothetical protein
MVVVTNRERSDSCVGPAADEQVGGAETGEQPELDRKATWGLYSVYIMIGLINGFFATYFQQPTICQYVFGPMGQKIDDKHFTTQSQCNVSVSVYQISWNFKLFFGFFLDVFGFLGWSRATGFFVSRRKGWMLFGWTGGLACLAVAAIFVDSFIKHHQYETYLMVMCVCCFFSTFSDVAGDGMIIEYSKFERGEQKGYILTTCQMLRFVMMMVSTALGMIFMSGPDYQPPGGAEAGSISLPFDISYSAMHWLLLGVSMPPYIGMWLWLKDPPVAVEHERGCRGLKVAFQRLWVAMKSYAVFNLLVMSVGIYGLAGMVNPANSPIAAIAQPTNIQSGIGAFLGNLFFVVGVWIFRKFFMAKNWRFTLFMTQAFVALCSALAIMIVYDTFGISQNGWFYMFQNSIPMLIQGIGQVVGSLAVVEISPPGLEATVYELLTSASNGAISLSTTLQTTFGKVFKVDEISYDNFHGPMHDVFVARMARATLFCLIVNVTSAAIFMWFLPKGPQMCKDWLEKKSWHTTWAGLLNVVVFAGPFFYANFMLLAFVASS